MMEELNFGCTRSVRGSDRGQCHDEINTQKNTTIQEKECCEKYSQEKWKKKKKISILLG